MRHPELVHLRLTTHPLTGAAIVPVGYRKNGRPIWPIMGGAEPDDDKKDPPKADKKPDDDDKKKDAPDPDEKDKGAGGKDALKADLARERDKRQELERSISDLRDGFARALGLKPEETSDTDKLSESVSALQTRLDKADRRAEVLEIATEHGITKDDLHMLTGTTTEELTKQAEWIKGKNAAVATATGKPKPDPSQGGGGEPVKGGDADAMQAQMERSLGRRSKQNA